MRIFMKSGRKCRPSCCLSVMVERQHTEELGRSLGIGEEIRFVGKQEQMEDILAIADLFLLTSEYESFGLAALEAMAAGVPVISTDAGSPQKSTWKVKRAIWAW